MMAPKRQPYLQCWMAYSCLCFTIFTEPSYLFLFHYFLPTSEIQGCKARVCHILIWNMQGAFSRSSQWWPCVSVNPGEAAKSVRNCKNYTVHTQESASINNWLPIQNAKVSNCGTVLLSVWNTKYFLQYDEDCDFRVYEHDLYSTTSPPWKEQLV